MFNIYRNKRLCVHDPNDRMEYISETSSIKSAALWFSHCVVSWVGQAARRLVEAITLMGAMIIAGLAISVVICLNILTELVCTMLGSEYRAQHS